MTHPANRLDAVLHESAERSCPEPGLPRFIDRLQRISSYFESYGKSRGGSLACYKHYRVTHYGMLAYLLPINGFLFRRTENEEYLHRALSMLGRLGGQLRLDQGQYVFYPGRLNKHNASNNAIDSGAVTDSLACWYKGFAEVTPTAQLEFIRDACSKVAGTYLRFARGKVTNQALWAMTGLASVHAFVEPREEYRAACIACLEQSFRDQNEDGSFPYLPFRLGGQDSPSLHDVSGFYHSRHVSFLLDVADKIDYPIDGRERDRLIAAADFLCALYRPDGSKSLEIEAKHWYWLGDGGREWASAPFDYHALSECYRRWRQPRHLRALRHAAANFLESCDEDGSVRTRPHDRDFQCTHFWSAHAAWVAKALDAYVPNFPEQPSAEAFSYDGEQSGVVCRHDARLSLQLRARKYPLTPLFGGYATGVTWLSLERMGRNRDLLPRRRWSFDAPGEAFQLPLSGLLKELVVKGSRGLLRSRGENRFALALIYHKVLVGRFDQASYLLRELILRRNLLTLAPIYSSFWSLESEWSFDGSLLRLGSRMSRADGSSDGGAWCEKHLTEDGNAVEVRLRLDNGLRSSLFLLPLPARVQRLTVEPVEIRRLGRSLLLHLSPGRSAHATYEIPKDDG